MIPDNIQANIMKYLNNGVSGSSQEQKPKVVGSLIDYGIVATAYTNPYITEDNKYMVVGTRYTENSVGKWGFMVHSVEDALQGTFNAFYEIPNYDGKTPYIMTGSLNRDEEGRYYTIIIYRQNNTNTEYLVLFNDFVTEGTIIINKAYNLNNVTFKASNNTTMSIADTQIEAVIKKNGSGEYIFYNNSFPTYITSENKYKYYFIKLTIEYNGTIKTQSYAYDITTEADNPYLKITDINVNNNSDNIYAMLTYNTTYSNVGGSIKPTNTNVGTITLLDGDAEYNEVSIKRLYNNNSYIYVGHTDYNYFNNGIYIRDLMYKYENNIITFKYILARADGTTQIVDFPDTITMPNLENINYSITNNFITLSASDTDSVNRVRRLYKLSNGVITFVEDISTLGVGTGATYIMQQYNLYFCFFLLVRPRVYIIEDVPTYGRDCILKQKLLNSKLFRIIKKYRNRRANIQ